jgi:hypothetical protein
MATKEHKERRVRELLLFVLFAFSVAKTWAGEKNFSG